MYVRHWHRYLLSSEHGHGQCDSPVSDDNIPYDYPFPLPLFPGFLPGPLSRFSSLFDIVQDSLEIVGPAPFFIGNVRGNYLDLFDDDGVPGQGRFVHINVNRFNRHCLR
ncbi:hypothetical protein ES708_12753 [subsurface metagenome]